MSDAMVKGWCPGAHRPMQSGDGLIMRVRPMLGQLSHAQALGLCEIAQEFGNGVIDLTNRANLQLRGIKEAAHPHVLAALMALDLLDATPEMESRRNIICAPLKATDGLSQSLARDLGQRLGELPPLPAKFGFAMDADGPPQLRHAPADIRIENGPNGLALKADTSPLSREITQDSAIDAVIALAHWFAKTRRPDVRRMGKHLQNTPLPEGFEATRALPPAPPLTPAQHAQGRVFGAPFGSMPADKLKTLLQNNPAASLTVTPFRMFMLQGQIEARDTGFITKDQDPMLHIDACPGAPACAAAFVETRPLAKALSKALAPHLQGKSLHVSGCAKGCARARAADVVLVGQNDGFHLVLNGCTWDEPVRHAIRPDSVITTVTQELGRS